MIKTYNFKETMDEGDVEGAKWWVDNLIERGEWNKTHPSYQTYANLYEHPLFHIFDFTFMDACMEYVGGCDNLHPHQKSKNLPPVKMWCYKDTGENQKSKINSMWHSHENYELSGILYLHNPDNVGTLFHNQPSPKPEPYTWIIFPSKLQHRAGTITTPNTPRYSLCADISLKL